MVVSARIGAAIKRAFLGAIFRGSGADLVTRLQAFQNSGFNALKNGGLVVSSSGAGHSVTFRIPTPGDAISPDEVFALSQELLELYDYAKGQLGVSDTDPNYPTDAQIYAAMLNADNFTPVSQVQTDYGQIRVPSVTMGVTS